MPSHTTADTLHHPVTPTPVPITPVEIIRALTTPVPTTHRSDVGILGATEVDTQVVETHTEPLVPPDTTIGAVAPLKPTPIAHIRQR